MGYRVLQIVIVGFWVVMTGLLVRSVVSEASRYTEVPLTEFAAQVLAKRVQSPTLLIFADGVEVGNALVFSQPVKRGDKHSGYKIRINGKLDTAHFEKSGSLSVATAVSPTVRFVISAQLGESGSAEKVNVELTPESSELKIHLGYAPEGEGLTYRVSDGGKTMYSNEGSGASDLLGKGGNMLLPALTAGGLPLAGLPSGLDGMAIAPEGGGISKLFVAKKGKAKMGKHDFSAYVIEMETPMGGEPVRLVFSISGELMAIENIPGHIIVADSFVAPAKPGEKHILTEW